MREFTDLFRQRAINVVGALVLRGIEQRRYDFASNNNDWQIEIDSDVEIRSSLIVWAHYPSDPIAPEFLRRQELFGQLATQWRKERNPLSSNAWDNVLNPAYQRIIGMGMDAVRFIFQELRRELDTGEADDWFIALWAITGENPVPTEHRGKIREMALAWLQWGSRQGYLDDEGLGI